MLALFERAVADIDLRTHRGEHPRLGAVDVVPFVPIEGVTMAECVALAKKVGADGRGAVRAAGLSLRRGVDQPGAQEPRGHPPRRVRRAGGEDGEPRLDARLRSGRAASDAPAPSVIGARMPLIAYNINLATDRLDVAKKIAAAIRHSSGGFRFVKAMGFTLEDRGIVQVSMNLTNYEKTPIFRVFETVKREAERYGVGVLRARSSG